MDSETDFMTDSDSTADSATYSVIDDSKTVKETKSLMNIETHSSLDCRETHN